MELRQLVDEVGDFQRKALGRGAHHERAVAVDGGVELQVAGSQHGLTPA